MSDAEVCWSCKRGEHLGCAAELTDIACSCTHGPDSATLISKPLSTIGAAVSEPLEEQTGFKRRLKDESSLKDIQSTGRKRAAALYPLKDENGKPLPCDFAGRRNVLPSFMQVQINGCGERPGTSPGIAQARHHHDYTVTNNERSNIGLLCHSCHSQLHAKNDPFKDVIYERIFGYRPNLEDLSHASKALKSGIVSGGMIQDADQE